jgi:ABC-type transporter Mla subunit MlaD
MADNFSIGPKLKIDGEAEFKRVVAGINKDMTVLGSEMKKVTAQYADNKDSIEALTAKSEVYSKQADEQKKKIDVIKEALQNSSREYGENSNQVKEWQIKLNNAEAALSGTENSLKQTKAQINDFGEGTNEATTETKQLGDKLDDTGKKALSFGDVLKANLISDVLVAGVKAIGSAISAAFGQMKELATAAMGTADELMALSDQTGISTEDLQVMKFQGDDLGVSLDTMTGTLSKLTKAMDAANGNAKDQVQASIDSAAAVQDLVDKHASYEDILKELSKTTDLSSSTQEKLAKNLISGKLAAADCLDAFQKGIPKTNDAAQAFMDLGVAITDQDGKLRDSKDVMADAIDALGNVPNATDRDILAMKLFGKSALELNPLIKAGSAGLAELAQQAQDSGAVMSDETVSALDNLGDSIDHMKTSAQAAAGALLARFAPAISDVASALPQLLQGNVSADEFIGKIAELVNQVTTTIVQMLPTLLETGSQILIALINGIVTSLPQIITAATGVIMQLTATLFELLPQIIEAGLQIIVQLAEGIATALPELIPTIVDTVLLIVETLINNIDLLVDAGIKIILGLTDGIVRALPRLVEKAPTLIIKLVDALVENLPKLLEAGLQMIVTLAGALIENVPTLVARIPEILTAVVNGFSTYYSRIWDIGSSFIAGLWQGISDKVAWLKNKISGFVNEVIDSIRRFFGISSPSKVMAGIGGFLSEGLAKGIEGKSGLVSAAMNKINKDLSANASIAVSGEAAARTSASGAGYLTTNLFLDNMVLATSTSKAQYRKSQSRARTYGMVPAS